MRTMQKMIDRFNRKYDSLHYYAELSWLDSYPGYYTVVIADELGYTARYHFRTCNEFREWMDGVVLD